MWAKYVLTMNTDTTKAALTETDLVPFLKRIIIYAFYTGLHLWNRNDSDDSRGDYF